MGQQEQMDNPEFHKLLARLKGKPFWIWGKPEHQQAARANRGLSLITLKKEKGELFCSYPIGRLISLMGVRYQIVYCIVLRCRQ